MATRTAPLDRLRGLLAGRFERSPRGPSREELRAAAERPPDWPRTCFFVCGGPRTGSTLLAGLLASSKRVGHAGEYFKKDREPAWAAADYAAFVTFTKRVHAIDGVFGAKLQWRHLQHLLERLRSSGTEPRLDDRTLLDAAFSRPRFIWIRRLDSIAQAVSWWKADLTGLWSSNAPPERATGREPFFNFEQIDQRVRLVEEWNAAWREWFAANRIEPFPLVYEELIEDLASSGRAALDFIGIDLPAETELRPRARRQSDEINADWISRYRELADGRTLPR